MTSPMAWLVKGRGRAAAPRRAGWHVAPMREMLTVCVISYRGGPAGGTTVLAPSTDAGMSQARWMLSRLALATSIHHARADEDRLTGFAIKTTSDYRAFLTRIYGFEAAVEQALMRVAGADAILIRLWPKMIRLRHDLEALGAELGALPLATSVNVGPAPQALGWQFVIERQALLSGLIGRHVTRTLGESVALAASYLIADAETPGARFREFGETVGHYARHGGVGPIVVAANEAFRAQRHWFRSIAPNRPVRPVAPLQDFSL